MSNFEYLNTRVCSMRSQLLSRSSIEEMLDLDSPEMIAERLLESPYHAELIESLAALPPARALDSALENNFHAVISKISRIADNESTDTLRLFFDQWDIQNLKAVIRGVHFQLPPDTILNSLGPGALLTRESLKTLADLTDLKAIADQLNSWSLPWGAVLLPLLFEYRTNLDLRPLEHALDAFRFTSISCDSSDSPIRDKSALELIRMEADIRNIITALTSLDDSTTPLFLPDYRHCSRTIKRICSAKTLEQAIDILADSPHRRILDKAFPFMTHAGRFSMFERLIDEELLTQSWRMSLTDPLSIAVPCHFLRAKRNEIMNIRLIAMGLDKHIQKNAISVGLIFAGVN